MQGVQRVNRSQVRKSFTSPVAEVKLYLRDADHEPRHKILGTVMKLKNVGEGEWPGALEDNLFKVTYYEQNEKPMNSV